MTDLSQLIADLCAGLEDVETPLVSGFLETVSGEGNLQHIDKTGSFRSFQGFRSEDNPPGSDDASQSKNIDLLAAAHARASSYSLESERPERPEIADYPPLAEGVSLFPVRDSEPERLEREAIVAGAFPFAAIPPPGDPFPISPAAVHTGIERELRALAEDGREGPDALRDAVAITRAKIRNSPALAERQVHDGRCHACDQALDGTRPEVAVLNPGGRALHLHHGECHEAHGRRRSALVDRIMAAAGYGAEQSTGEAT